MVFYKRKNSEKQNDETMALAALALQKPYPSGDCPDPEQLAALVDDRLQKNERHRIFRHLDSCSSCYRKWLTLAAETQKEEIEKKSTPFIFSSKKRGIIFGSLGITAVAAFLLLCFLWMTRSGLEIPNLINASYQTVLGTEESFGENPLFIFPWEKTRQIYGFGHPGELSAKARTFAVGLWKGREDLKIRKTSSLPPFLDKNQNWKETQSVSCYLLGRWTALLWGACLAEKTFTGEFWKDQKQIADYLQNVYAGSSAKQPKTERVRKVLEKFCPYLDQGSHKPLNKRQKKSMVREIERFVEYMLTIKESSDA